MTERTRNVIVGATSLAALLCLGVLLWLFGYGVSLFEEGYLINVQLKSASGLTRDSIVLMSGIPAGKVVSVGLQQTKSGPKVSVLVRVKPQVDVPVGVRVKAEAPLIGGSPTLAFDIGHLEPTNPDYSKLIAPLPKNGTAIIEGETFNPLGELASQFRVALAEPAKSFDRLATSVEQVSAEWTLVGKNLNAILEARSLGEVDSGSKLGNLATVLARVDSRMKEMETTVTALNKWLDDNQLRQDVRQTVASAKSAAAKMDGLADKANVVMEHADQNVELLIKRYIAAGDDLSKAILSFKATMDAAREGKGTVGKLINDPAMYDGITDAAQRLEGAVKDIQLLVEKWKKEGLPVQF